MLNKSTIYNDIAKIIKIQKNINAKNEKDYEYTALHYGSSSGDEDIIRLLLNNGAEPNVEDKYGNTPLHWGINIWKKLYK